MIVIAGTIRIDPARSEEAAAAIREITRETLEEEGNLAYAFSTDLDEEGLFHLFEKWESQEGLDLHFETPHMAAFQKRVPALGVKEMKLEKFEVASVGPVF